MWLFSGALVAACMLGLSLPVPRWIPLLLLMCAWLLRPHGQRRLAWCLWLLAGALWGAQGLHQGLSGWLPHALEGESLEITGRLTGLPESAEVSDGVQRWRLVLNQVHPSSEHRDWAGPHRVRLSAWGYPGPFKAGDELRLKVRLRRPRGLVNEGSMDSARLDLARGISARGSVRQVLDHEHRPRSPQALRQHFSEEVHGRLGNAPRAARFLPALVAGDRRHLESRDWKLLQRTGTAHLMAISGLHITLVTGLVWWLGRWLLAPALLAGVRLPGLSAQQLAVVPAMLAACGYAALAGFALPTLRALVMNLVALVALVLRVRPRFPDALGAALFVLLLMDPLAALDNSFWLSFVAVAMLLLLAVGGADASRFAGALRVQAVLATGLGALTGWLFLYWGLLAPVANLVMVPLFSLLIVPLALGGALLPGAGILLDGAAWLLEGSWLALTWLDRVNPMLAPPASALAMALVMIAVLLAFLPRLGVPRWLALFLLLPWLFPRHEPPAPGEFDLVVMDVGQGQAIAARTRNHLVLYDLGPAWPGGDAGRAVVRPWLRRQPQSLSMALASHGDSDHAGGLSSLVDLVPPEALFSGEPERVAGSRPCRRGQHWRYDGVDFRVLWPDPDKNIRRSNNRSCVLHIEGRAGSVLLTGDITRAVEYWLAERHAGPVTVLQVPHHGSSTSSSYTLLRALAPERAVASTGHGNPFGHPAQNIARRYRELGIPLHVTATSGMIVFHLRHSHNAAPLEWRTRHPRPWRPDTDASVLELPDLLERIGRAGIRGFRGLDDAPHPVVLGGGAGHRGGTILDAASFAPGAPGSARARPAALEAGQAGSTLHCLAQPGVSTRADPRHRAAQRLPGPGNHEGKHPGNRRAGGPRAGTFSQHPWNHRRDHTASGPAGHGDRHD